MDPLDDVRLKDVDDLTDEDKGVLKDNWDDLTDDERVSFKDSVEIEDKSDDDDDKGDKGDDDDKGDKGDDDDKDDKKKEEKKPFSFESKEEFDTAVSTATTKAIEARDRAKQEAKQQEEDAKKKPEKFDRQFFPKGHKAADWNDAANTIYDKVKEGLVAEGVIEEAIQGLSTQRKKQFDTINQRFDAEIAQIRTVNPDLPTKGTKEGDAFESELAKIGVEYKGVSTMGDAYNIYKVVKKASVKKAEEGDDGDEGDDGKKKIVPSKQKELAKKIGKGGGGGKKGDKQKSYARIASRSMDDLIDEELEKMG